MADTSGRKPAGQALQERMGQIGEQMQGSQAWAAIFRPGSIFRRDIATTPGTGPT